MKADLIFDLTPGTGAAALAALLLGISYDAVCINAAHKKWLEQLLNRALAALTCASASGGKGIKLNNKSGTESETFMEPLADKELIEGIRKYFYALGEEGATYFRPYDEENTGADASTNQATGGESAELKEDDD